MVSTRNEAIIKTELIDYLCKQGLDVRTSTKARGNKGFFREGRIDVSKTLDDNSSIKVILHEYAHYVNFLLDTKFKEPRVLFNTEPEQFYDELISVTNFVDTTSLCEPLILERKKINKTIKVLTGKIRTIHPKFNPNGEFKQFKRYAMWSNLGYLEKYDRVKLLNWFSAKTYSITNVRKDFPNIPDVFVDYLQLRSKQRRRARITRKISKLNKYYTSPTELFARFVEGMYVDMDMVRALAPMAYSRFLELYQNGYYGNLAEVFEIIGVEVS